jgi:GntR family transcriptional regulator
LRSGEPLPREGDLCESFDVSRTVMREALILLEEDGLIRTRRGIGRFVADELPALGLERLRPIEELIASPGDVTVRRLQSRVEDETDFTQRLASPQVYLSECVVDGASGPIALVQEWVHLEWLRQRMPGVIDSDDAKSTVLSMILEHRRPSISRATCLIAASNAGAERSRLFGAKPRDAVLILTQTLEAETGPFYLSKTLLGASANHLAINQIIQ